MRGRVFFEALVLLVLGIFACTFPLIKNSPAAPSMANITRLPGLHTIALYRFVDRRGLEPRAAGKFGGPSNDATAYTLARPVDELVTKGFRLALQARCFSVIDRTATPFSPGIIPPDGAFAVSGDVVRYFMDSGSIRHPMTEAECEVIVRVFRGEGEGPVFEKSYLGGGWKPGTNALSEALRKVVWKTVTDPEFLQSIR